MDVAGDLSSEDVPEQQTLAAGLPEWARERADGRWYEPSTAGQSSQRAKPKAPTSLIVVLPDEGEDDWAKARVFDSPEEATALVQTLVEGGLAPEGVSVFSATQMVVDVAYRPVVDLKQRRKRSKPRG
jgi:hypothetical protein